MFGPITRQVVVSFSAEASSRSLRVSSGCITGSELSSSIKFGVDTVGVKSLFRALTVLDSNFNSFMMASVEVDSLWLELCSSQWLAIPIVSELTLSNSLHIRFNSLVKSVDSVFA